MKSRGLGSARAGFLRRHSRPDMRPSPANHAHSVGFHRRRLSTGRAARHPRTKGQTCRLSASAQPRLRAGSTLAAFGAQTPPPTSAWGSRFSTRWWATGACRGRSRSTAACSGIAGRLTTPSRRCPMRRRPPTSGIWRRDRGGGEARPAVDHVGPRTALCPDSTRRITALAYGCNASSASPSPVVCRSQDLARYLGWGWTGILPHRPMR
jgi:hypothetical protein